MEIINAIEIHVLCVPGESGLPHAKIEIRSVDTVYTNTVVFIDVI